MPALLAFFLILLTPLVSLAQTCTHYASQNGTGDGSSTGSPFTISAFGAIQGPGNVLCLLDGVYFNTIEFTFAGTSGNPVTIRALNDGAVTVQTGDSRGITMYGTWGVIAGLNIAGGDNKALSILGTNLVARRVVVWNNSLSNAMDNAIDMAGANNLLEDCALFGNFRKGITAGATVSGTTNNTIRRCWARWEQRSSGGSPSELYEIGYSGQSGVTCENCIGTRDVMGYSTAAEGPILLTNTADSQVLGSIVYETASANFQHTDLFTVRAGSTDYPVTNNVLVKHVLTFISPSNPLFSSVESFHFDQLFSGKTATIQDSVGVGGGWTGCPSPTYTCTNVRTGNSIANALGNSNSVWDEIPGICRQYVNRTLTSTALWPWSMDSRIAAALTASGRAPLPGGTVTTLMESMFGPIPSSCRTGSVTPVATAIEFTQFPITTVENQTIMPAVAARIVDQNGSPFPANNILVTVAISTNPGSWVLHGTLERTTTSNGTVTFPDLSISGTGNNGRLQLTASGLTSATSALFDIVSTPAPTGLRLRLPLGSDKLDIGPDGYDGTGGGTTFVAGCPPTGSGLQFTRASSEQVTNATFPWTATDGITVSAWVYTPGVAGSWNGLFEIGPGDRGGDSNGVFAPNDLGNLEWFYGSNQESCQTPFTGYLNKCTWVTVTGSGPTGYEKKIYLNGALKQTCTGVAPQEGILSGDLTADSTSYSIGANQPFGTRHFFEGRIADFTVYNEVKDAQWVQDTYHGFTPPTVPITDSFKQSTLDIPLQTYGPGREACQMPGPNDVTLATTDSWESVLETSASPGKAYFLRGSEYTTGGNTGTYTTTNLDLASGTVVDRITIKPYNCETVTINAIVQPGHYTTLAGMALTHTGTSGQATLNLPNSRTGVIIRNNTITANGHYNVNFGSAFLDSELTGNNIVMAGTAQEHQIYVSALGTNAFIQQNKFSTSSTGTEDVLQFYNWQGQWNVSGNWFVNNPNENYLDIKYSALGATNVLLTVEDNYFDGSGLPAQDCMLVHNASDSGIGSGYSYTVDLRRNYFYNCPSAAVYHRISTGTGEGTDISSRTLHAYHNIFHMTGARSANGALWCESDHCDIAYNTFINGELKTIVNSNDPADCVVRNNIFYATNFNGNGVDTCANNDLYTTTGTSLTCTDNITTDPLFVNVASDWRLQSGSPARGAAEGGGDMGAIPFVPPPLPPVQGIPLAAQSHFFGGKH